MNNEFIIRPAKLLASISLICGLFFTLSFNEAKSAISQSKLNQFVDEMTTRHNFNKNKLISLLKKSKFKPKIIAAISKPAEGMPWYKYRKIFITSERIKNGVKFWNKHEKTLARASKEYGVPAEIIVAILGVETLYGERVGTHRVLDALVTLAFGYPKRSKFFRQELEQFLLLTRDEKLDPLAIVGSYAGAMGKPQFISSSYRHYAVDFDNNGKRDLLHSTEDAIGSIANYFKKHKWQPKKPIVSRVTVQGSKYKKLLKKGLKPHTSISGLKKLGINVTNNLSDNLMGNLVEFETKSGTDYWVGLDNFYVITRYNRSALYAMAVYQLSQKVLDLRSVMGLRK